MRLYLLPLALALVALPAGAQTKRPILTGNPIQDINNAVHNGGSSSGGGGSSQSPIQALIEMLTDTDAAIALSTSIPQVQDPVGGSCWKSFSGISAVVKAHPNILTGKASADLEAMRLVHIGLNQVCANPNCGQMWNDLNNVTAALNPTSLPVSLTSICAKIPVIGTSAAPSAPPAVSATTATPTATNPATPAATPATTPPATPAPPH